MSGPPRTRAGSRAWSFAWPLSGASKAPCSTWDKRSLAGRLLTFCISAPSRPFLLPFANHLISPEEGHLDRPGQRQRLGGMLNYG